MFQKIKKFLLWNTLINTIITNDRVRTILLSFGSLLIGIAYAAFSLVVGLLYRSLWYGALACYYIMLDVLRGGVLLNRYKSKKEGSEEKGVRHIRQYRICGVLFIFMTVFLAAMVLHIARQDKTFEYSLTVIYMAAGYTFYRIAISVYNFVRSRKQRDYTIRALRCINLSAALVSFLSLQSAALTAFSKNADQIFMNALTGGIVCGAIVIMGIYMIICGTLELRRKRVGAIYPQHID